MKSETDFEKVAPDDPNRCQATYKHGQCPFRAVPGSKYCKRHHGTVALDHKAKENKRMYLLGKWQARLNQLADHPEIKSLREEIGILRMMLEGIIEPLESQNDFLVNAASISKVVTDIERLVSSCHKIEKDTGTLLDKSTLLRFGDELVALIADNLADHPEKLKLISTGITKLLERYTTEST